MFIYMYIDSSKNHSKYLKFWHIIRIHEVKQVTNSNDFDCLWFAKYRTKNFWNFRNSQKLSLNPSHDKVISPPLSVRYGASQPKSISRGEHWWQLQPLPPRLPKNSVCIYLLYTYILCNIIIYYDVLDNL